MNIKEAIKNLEVTSLALDNFANSKENYNQNYAQYLENMSFELSKYASELKDLQEIFFNY